MQNAYSKYAFDDVKALKDFKDLKDLRGLTLAVTRASDANIPGRGFARRRRWLRDR